MRSLIVGLAGLSIALGGATAVMARDAAPAAAPATAPATAPAAAPATPAAAPATIPAAAGKASVESTTIGDLIAKPGSKAVLTKDYPELLAYPGLDDIKGMTLRDISKYPQANLDDARLASIQKDLDTAPN